MKKLPIRYALFFYISCIYSFSSCNNYLAHDKDSYLHYVTDSPRFNVDYKQIADFGSSSATKYFFDSATKKEYIVILSCKKSDLFFYNLTGRLIKKYHIHGLPNGEFWGGIWDFYIANADLFYFSHGDGIISQCDTTKLLHTYKITKKLDDSYYCYSLQSYSSLKINKDSSFYMMMIDRTSDPHLANWLQHRYTPPCIGKFLLHNDSIICIDSIGYFPQDYKKIYHYDVYTYFTVHNNNLVYTFSYADSIFIQNTLTHSPRRALAIKEYKKDYQPLPFIKDSSGNILYIERYFVETPSVSLFVYDPYHNVYYLGIQDGIKFVSKDGTSVHDINDSPQELFILNQQFRKIKKIFFPGGRFKSLSNAIITPKGMFLPINSKRKLQYEVFNFF